MIRTIILVLTVLFLNITNNSFANNRKEMRLAKKWAMEICKTKNFQLKFWKKTNFIELKKQYESNPQMWEIALNTIAKADKNLSAFKPIAKRELYGEKCYLTISEYIPKHQDKIRSEKHDKFIDIQISTGNVLWGIDTKENAEETIPYNSKKDVAFYKANTSKIIKQNEHKPYIFVFFPEDLHVPSFSKTKLTKKLVKLVIKVENN
jgi:uncharacterized protein, YhcH/YjgK/YiaL family